jgi:WD40 repeat protein
LEELPEITSAALFFSQNILPQKRIMNSHFIKAASVLHIFLLSVSLYSQEKAELIVPVGHSDYITSIDVSPDNKYLLSGSKDRTAKIWDIQSGKELLTLWSGESDVTAVDISPDGKKMLVADEYGNLVIYSWPELKRIFSNQSGRAIFTAGFSPDGNFFIAGEWKTVKVYSAVTMSYIGSFSAHVIEGTVADVIDHSFSPDSKLLATAGSSGRIIVYELPAGRMKYMCENKVEDLTTLTWSLDGKEILSNGGNKGDSILLWNAQNGKFLGTKGGHKGRIYSIVWAPDSSVIASGGYDDDVSFWHNQNYSHKMTIKQNPDEIYDMAFSSDGSIIFTAGREQSIRMWDASTGLLLKHFKALSRSADVCRFTSDNLRIVTGYTSPNRRYRNDIAVWDLAGTSGCRFFKTDYEVEGPVVLAISPDGKQLAAAASFDQSNIRFYDMTSYAQTGMIRRSHGSSRDVTFLYYAADSKKIYSGSEDYTIRSWDLKSYELLKEYSGHDDPVNGLLIMPDQQTMISSDEKGNIISWDLNSGNIVKKISNTRGENVLSFNSSRDAKWFAISESYGNFQLWKSETPLMTKIIPTMRMHSALAICFSHDNRKLYTGGLSGEIKILDIQSGKSLAQMEGHTNRILSLDASADGRIIASGSSDNSMRLWDASVSKELLICVPIDSIDWVMATPDHYYFCSKGALGSMAFRYRGSVYPFAQFDLQYNRPDIVLERAGYADKELIRALRRAYEKRLRRLQFDESMFSTDFHMPVATIPDREKIPLTTASPVFQFSLEASDDKYLLDKVFVSINDVPMSGSQGISLRDQKSAAWKDRIEVQLGEGKNIVSFSVMNEKGVESLKQTAEITYIPQKSPERTLYLCIISVSDYKDTTFNLKYAVKDGRDMALFMSEGKGFSKVHTDTLFDKNATRENILKLREKLMKSKVDDQVVLYLSGHGLLDDSLDFYYATWDVDFMHPAVRGITYEELEGLLDGIPARSKIMFMDACHSGEIDQEDVVISADAIALADGKRSGIKSYSYKGLKIESGGSPAPRTSFDLMQELFANLDRGSGAVVISAASGMGFALESDEWNNGVFTYALISGLRDKQADVNRNGRVSVNELRSYITNEVSRLTSGSQKPAGRRENLSTDWNIW